jgi:hypothetical protein
MSDKNGESALEAACLRLRNYNATEREHGMFTAEPEPAIE